MSDAHEPTQENHHRRRRRRRIPGEELLKERIDAVARGDSAPQQRSGSDAAPGAEAKPAQSIHQPRSQPPKKETATSEASLLRGCFRLLKLATRFTILLYLLALALLAWSLDRFGQTNLTTAALMYLPPMAWIAPAFILFLPALLLDWKSALLLPVSAGLYFVFFLDYQWRPQVTPGAPTPFDTVRVLTWNRGQGKKASLRTYSETLKPDFILLQDAAGRGAGYRKDPAYAEFREVAQTGEFVIMSRWPILSAEGIGARTTTGSLARGGPVAARFVVVAAGRRITLYSIHLPSPRDALESYKRGSFLWGVLGVPGTPWESKKRHYQAFWDEKVSLAREILERAEAEEGPLILAGDFNTPAFGPIYRMFAGSFTDAHTTTGSGLGFTFPGDTGNPFALFQPWLRLDQIHASQHWQVLNTAPQDAAAQHLPVFAELKLTKPAP
jgi:vancomycin resistance protein VanJ